MLLKYLKTRLTSTVELLPNVICISCVIGSNWKILESPGRKSDWEGAKDLLLIE